MVLIYAGGLPKIKNYKEIKVKKNIKKISA